MKKHTILLFLGVLILGACISCLSSNDVESVHVKALSAPRKQLTNTNEVKEVSKFHVVYDNNGTVLDFWYE